MSRFVQNQVPKLRYALIRAKKFHHSADYFPVLIEDLTIKGMDKELKAHYGAKAEICTVAVGTWHEMVALQQEIEQGGEHAWVEYLRTGKQAVLRNGDNTRGTFAREVRVIAWGSQQSCTEQMLRAEKMKGAA